MFVIGMAGKAKAGKDLCAKFFVSRGFKRYGFADPIKETINPLMGWDDRHGFGDLKDKPDPFWGVSPRYVYQVFGTDFARQRIGFDFWLKVAEKRLLGNTLLVVIPDIRFNNEAQWVRDRGILFHVYRSSAPSVNSHISESGVDRKPEDFRVLNEGTLEELNAELIRIYQDIVIPTLRSKA